MKIYLKSKKTQKLIKKDILDICKLKNSHWDFGLKKQFNWFKKNIKKNDLHNFIIFKNEIIGYTCLRMRTFFLTKDTEKKYLYFDTLIINKKYRKYKLSYKLMNFNSKVIESSNRPSFLICKKKLYNFYKKFNWKLTNRIIFKLEDHKTNKRIMSFNLKKNKFSKTKIFINK